MESQCRQGVQLGVHHEMPSFETLHDGASVLWYRPALQPRLLTVQSTVEPQNLEWKLTRPSEVGEASWCQTSCRQGQQATVLEKERQQRELQSQRQVIDQPTRVHAMEQPLLHYLVQERYW